MTSFKVADHVFGLGNPHASKPRYYGCRKPRKVPTGFTFDDVVIFPVNTITSFAALFHPKGFGFPALVANRQIKPDWLATKTILVVGGGLNAGKLAIQLAKLAGIERIVTIAPAGNSLTLQKFSATHVIDRHEIPETIAEGVKRIVGPEGVVYLYDCMSSEDSFSISLVSNDKANYALDIPSLRISTGTCQGIGN